jgi:predicted phosphodiesterase
LATRVAVISDIHANAHALSAVLEAIEDEAPDELWCLGDVVGYGPQPNECCEVVSERSDLSLAGNHDLVVLGALSIDDFAGDAAAAARWTQTVLQPQARAYLEGLSSSATRAGVELFHGSPRDPVWDYVLTEEAASSTFAATDASVVLVGHSHVPLAISLDEALAGGVAGGGTEIALESQRWILNPGSVGQPRQGDPRAAWLLLDLGAGRASFKRAEYDIERTQEEMRERGLPDALAQRLAHGI